MRADGRIGCSRLKRCEYTSGIAIIGETIWCKLPKTADLTKLDDRWRTWGSRTEAMSTSSDWRMEQSWHDQFDGKSKASAGMSERALKMVTGTPWNPRPGEVVARRRCMTRALVERYGPTEDCGACFRKSQQHTERCRARIDLLCAREDGPVEARAQEGSQLHQIQQHRISSQRQRQHRQVESTRT